jgi:hypothetical protein
VKIETKYSVGDRVYAARSGRVYCSLPVLRRGLPVQSRPEPFVYEVRRRTIGSVQVDTAPHRAEEGHVSYMCLETGVGSDTILGEEK